MTQNISKEQWQAWVQARSQYERTAHSLEAQLWGQPPNVAFFHYIFMNPDIGTLQELTQAPFAFWDLVAHANQARQESILIRTFGNITLVESLCRNQSLQDQVRVRAGLPSQDHPFVAEKLMLSPFFLPFVFQNPKEVMRAMAQAYGDHFGLLPWSMNTKHCVGLLEGRMMRGDDQDVARMLEKGTVFNECFMDIDPIVITKLMNVWMSPDYAKARMKNHLLHAHIERKILTEQAHSSALNNRAKKNVTRIFIGKKICFDKIKTTVRKRNE